MVNASCPIRNNPERDAHIASRLESWFHTHARDLPWRKNRNGYTALVAEAMLQQTQVRRVVDRFRAFLERFPDVASLAQADEQQVLAMWQGLGYYRRARMLHQAAQQIISMHGGEVPARAADLIALPGVGRYTAGAIASIVHQERSPIVDGNVARVIARIDAFPHRLGSKESNTYFWQRAASLVNHASQPGHLNEGIMELGAIICTPANPDCASCPLVEACHARASGRQREIPKPRQTIERKTIHHHAMIVEHCDQLLLEQRPPNGLWAGMWQPPAIEHNTQLKHASLKRQSLRSDLTISASRHLASFTHQTTHRIIRFHVHRAELDSKIDGVWRDPDAIDDLPLSNAHKHVIDLWTSHCNSTEQRRRPTTIHVQRRRAT